MEAAMSKNLLREAKLFLNKQQFLTTGTVDRQGKPHVSPKLLLKAAEKYIYIADYQVKSTYNNLKINPNISVCSFNIVEVFGYHIYGKAQIIERGTMYKNLLRDWQEGQTSRQVDKIIEDVRGECNMRSLKLTFLKPVVIYKVKISSVQKVDSRGLLEPA